MILKPGLAASMLMAVALAASTVLAAGPKAPSTGAAAPPPIAPLAEKLLTETCQVLGSAKAFSFHAEINFDQVLPSAVKVQFAAAMDFALQRPGELAVNYQSDLGGKQLSYQNGTLAIFDPPHMVYATVAMPPTIDAMLDRAATMHNLTIPLSDFGYTDPCARIRKQVIFGAYVGLNDVNGIACDHLSFSAPKVDLQLWLQHAGKLIPRKFVINYRNEPGSPEYIAVLSNWKFPSKIPESLFRPQIPKKAVHIDILKVKEAKP